MFISLSKEQLAKIYEEPYTVADHGLLHNSVGDRALRRLAEYLPKWLAPNFITLCGFLFHLPVHICAFVQLYHFPHNLTPNLVSLLVFVNVFHFVCDGLDGIHARRINCTSVVGEVLDHSLDSVIGVSIAAVVALVEKRGSSFLVGVSVLLVNSIFFLTFLRYFVDGKVELHKIGPQEGTLLFVAIVLLNYITERRTQTYLNFLAFWGKIVVETLLVLSMARKVFEAVLHNEEKESVVRSLVRIVSVWYVLFLANLWTVRLRFFVLLHVSHFAMLNLNFLTALILARKTKDNAAELVHNNIFFFVGLVASALSFFCRNKKLEFWLLVLSGLGNFCQYFFLFVDLQRKDKSVFFVIEKKVN